MSFVLGKGSKFVSEIQKSGSSGAGESETPGRFWPEMAKWRAVACYEIRTKYKISDSECDKAVSSTRMLICGMGTSGEVRRVFGICNEIAGSIFWVGKEEHKRLHIWYDFRHFFRRHQCCPQEKVFARCVKNLALPCAT